MKKIILASLLVYAATAIVGESYANVLPRPEKPGFTGCSRDLGNPKNDKELAKALWCVRNTDEGSDKNFWAQAKKHLTSKLTSYRDADYYLEKLGLKIKKDAEAGPDKRLPDPKKPGLTGCKASLGAPKTKVELAQALWCINNTTSESDRNFWAAAQGGDETKSVKHYLVKYKQAGDANAADYLDKLTGDVRELRSDSSKPRLPLADEKGVGFLGCPASLVETKADAKNNLAKALGCIKRNMRKIDYPHTPINTSNPKDNMTLPDPNFMLATLPTLLGDVSKGKNGLLDQYDDADTASYKGFLIEISKAWESQKEQIAEDSGS